MPYGFNCNLPTPMDCYFDQTIGICSVALIIAIFYLMQSHFMSKHAKREGLLTSVKTWLLLSMMLYSIYLASVYNFHIDITINEFTKIMGFLNLLIRKYLNSLAMVLAAYYFFTKAVKGFIYKLFWR